MPVTSESSHFRNLKGDNNLIMWTIYSFYKVKEMDPGNGVCSNYGSLQEY